MHEEHNPLDEKLKQALKKFDEITGVLSGVLRPPNDLRPEKRGIVACLGVGTIGIVALAYLKASWPPFVAEVVLVTVIAILVGYKRKKNG